MNSNPCTPSMQQNEEFLRTGGIYRGPLRQLYEKGILNPAPGHLEFPKCLNLPLGVREYERTGEQIIHGSVQPIRWTERREEFCAAVVQDADEEDATRAAFALAPELGVSIDPDWTAERIRKQVDLAQRVRDGKTKAVPFRVHIPGDPAARAMERVKELEARLAEVEAISAKPAEKPVAPRKVSSKGSAALMAAEAAEAPEAPAA